MNVSEKTRPAGDDIDNDRYWDLGQLSRVLSGLRVSRVINVTRAGEGTSIITGS